MKGFDLNRAAAFLKRAARLPPRVLARKAQRMASRAATVISQRVRDRLRSTYAALPAGAVLNPLLDRLDHGGRLAATPLLHGLAVQYGEHRFDLLGSGWVKVACTHAPPGRGAAWLRGRVPRASFSHAARVWGLVDEGYAPVDWQLDFKSGYRWSAARHRSAIPVFGYGTGVDIKVPWELARCQHLPQLALAFHASGDPSVMGEFRNQVLDFIAQNPPRFGVNWVCTMDVAIRVANWLLARDLFRAAGAPAFDEAFEKAFRGSVYDHARHIATHLEWNDTVRGNHYLADVCGLLFAAAALPASAQTDLWLAFAIQELVSEAGSQFHDEGANFEASTVYHRLSCELVLYSVAVVLGLPASRVLRLGLVKPARLAAGVRYRGLDALLPGSGARIVIPHWLEARMARMAGFVADVSRADGTVIQVGDNDSGRLFKLPGAYHLRAPAELRARYANLADWQPPGLDAPLPDEDVLDHAELVDAIAGLQGHAKGCAGAVVQSMARGRSLAPAPSAPPAPRVGDEAALVSAQASLRALSADCRQTYVFALPAQSPIERTFAYGGFGLYGWHSARWRAWIRCGSVGQAGVGGHAHNDALALELEVDGVPAACDPGTYAYTPFPHLRNLYRSAAAHFVPRVRGREPGRLDLGLFVLPDTPGLACLYFGRRGFVGVHDGYGARVMRIVCIEAGQIRVDDGSWGEGLERCMLPTPIPVSPKYGARLR